MKTVIYSEIDGIKVIRGFDNPVGDPVETARIVDPLWQDSAEFKAVEDKKLEFNEAVRALHKAAGKKDEAGYKAALDAMKARQEDLIPLARARKRKLEALRLENAVYFTPRQGEVIRTQEEVNQLKAAMNNRPEGMLITLDGAQIQDNRGKVCFYKASGRWTRKHILKLGDPIPAGAVLQSDVTETQWAEIQRDLVAALPDDVKLREKKKALAIALNQAAEMRSRLEIQGDADALQKSQDWYNAEVERLETLYS